VKNVLMRTQGLS